MKRKIRISILFIMVLLLNITVFASPAYYYANTYNVEIINVNNKSIEKVEVLAPISEGKDNVDGVKYEYISSSLFNYYGEAPIENDIKCFIYEDVNELKFKENKCIIKIKNINDTQRNNYNLYFGGDVFLRITKTNGEVVYTKMFSYYNIVDENSTQEEFAEARRFPNKIGEFECDLESDDKILEVKLLNNEKIEKDENTERMLFMRRIVWIVVFANILIIWLVKRPRKNKDEDNECIREDL